MEQEPTLRDSASRNNLLNHNFLSCIRTLRFIVATKVHCQSILLQDTCRNVPLCSMILMKGMKAIERQVTFQIDSRSIVNFCA